MDNKDPNPVIRIQSVGGALDAMRRFSHRAKRTIDIFSHQLVASAYDDQKLLDGISQLVRRSAQSQLRILVRDTRPLYGCDRPLLNLVYRLPSHAQIRRYTDGASNPNYGFFCCDQLDLVYLADEPNWSGYARSNAAAESRNALEEFNTLWTYGSKVDPNLRRLNI